MTSITASMNINRRGAFRLGSAILNTLRPAILDDTTQIGDGAMDDGTVASRTERLMVTYKAALRPQWRRGYL